jgi:hypothetical protein
MRIALLQKSIRHQSEPEKKIKRKRTRAHPALGCSLFQPANRLSRAIARSAALGITFAILHRENKP